MLDFQQFDHLMKTMEKSKNNMKHVKNIFIRAILLMFFSSKAYCADGDKWITTVLCRHVIFKITPPNSNDSILITSQSGESVYRIQRLTNGKSVYNETMYFNPGYNSSKILDLNVDVDQEFPVSFDQFGQTSGKFKIQRPIGSYVGSIICPNSPIGGFSGTFKIIELTGTLIEKSNRLFGTLTSSEPFDGELIYLVIGEGKGQSSFWKYPGRTYFAEKPSTYFAITMPTEPQTSPYGWFTGNATRIPSGGSNLGLVVQISEKPNGPWTPILTITNSLPKIFTNQFYRIILK